jgi:hypothetical protein
MVIVGVVAVGGVALKLRGSGNGDKKEERYYDSSYDRQAHDEAKARRPGKGGDEDEDWDEYYKGRR